MAREDDMINPVRPHNENMRYRPEIDGLRAIAVLSVLFFHAGFSFLPGGYIGVDIFFVISGFLITSIILREKEKEKFSLLRFYERRARRILPALFFMLAATLPLALWLLLPMNLEKFASSLISVILFVSNIYFWKETDYFGQASGQIPLLHTWSLGVEEQYYIFFPLIIMALWRFGYKRVFAAVAGLAALSLVISQWGSTENPDANFYLMPARAWELLIGSLIAFAGNRPATHFSGRKKDILSMLGLVLIIASLTVYTDETPFPSLYALVPTVGAGLVLAFAREGTLCFKILSTKSLVWIGLISYSAYLWHQPLFVFARMYSIDGINDFDYSVLIITSLVCGWFSWRFVENPFRYNGYWTRRRIFAYAGAASFFALCLGSILLLGNGYPQRFPESTRHLLAFRNTVETKAYVNKYHRGNVEGKAFSDKDSRPKILIIGDSYSQDFVNNYNENGYLKKYQVSAFYIPAKCQIYAAKDDVNQFYSAEIRSNCSKRKNVLDIKDRISAANVVILASNWRDWSAERLPETIKAMNLRKDQKLFVIGSKGFAIGNIRQYFGKSREELAAIRIPAAKGKKKVNEILKEEFPSSVYVDQFEAICDADYSCPIFTPEGDLISLDGGHLTKQGAVFVGKALFERTVIGGLEHVKFAKTN
jgi:peptidoglycan/LPS O-acetylase OafA/YrhL